MMLKILQGATVAVFVLFAVIGGVILFAAPDKLPGYLSLISTLAPLFVAEVVPAFLGKPLKDFVAGINEKKNGAPPAGG